MCLDHHIVSIMITFVLCGPSAAQPSGDRTASIESRTNTEEDSCDTVSYAAGSSREQQFNSPGLAAILSELSRFIMFCIMPLRIDLFDSVSTTHL